jgi:hypothetical protein
MPFFLRHVTRYALTDHVHNMTLHNSLHIYALEERCRTTKSNGMRYLKNLPFKTDPKSKELPTRLMKKCWTTEKMTGE